MHGYTSLRTDQIRADITGQDRTGKDVVFLLDQSIRFLARPSHSYDTNAIDNTSTPNSALHFQSAIFITLNGQRPIPAASAIWRLPRSKRCAIHEK
mmetsp:Transcript_23377/g.65241  ORF Transcript_23377/g.65241 Transcript_23377/m.65241 type:complete len:96 (-) Transcript_23377:656-943(-)